TAWPKTSPTDSSRCHPARPELGLVIPNPVGCCCRTVVRDLLFLCSCRGTINRALFGCGCPRFGFGTWDPCLVFLLRNASTRRIAADDGPNACTSTVTIPPASAVRRKYAHASCSLVDRPHKSGRPMHTIARVPFRGPVHP